jgi:hypothetical protein
MHEQLQRPLLSPTTRGIGELLPRLDVDRVLVGSKLPVAVFELAPEAVQMDRVLHHRVVDEGTPAADANLQRRPRR